LDRKTIIQRISHLWDESYVTELIATGDNRVQSVEQWYLKREGNSIRIDTENVIKSWAYWSNLAVEGGRAGLRVFGDLHSFFEYGIFDLLVDYELRLKRTFDAPLTAHCGYLLEDICKLSEKDFSELEKHHLHVYMI
jgi:hypothetical protein